MFLGKYATDGLTHMRRVVNPPPQTLQRQPSILVLSLDVWVWYCGVIIYHMKQ